MAGAGYDKNKFCQLRNLDNESDVEQFFVVELLAHLGYTDDYLRTKTTVQEETIGKGKRRRIYVPDYIGYADRKKRRPVLIIDAKAPDGSAEEGVREAQDYAAVVHRKLQAPKP